jgi:roadblock/LC7 domain-containing protein
MSFTDALYRRIWLARNGDKAQFLCYELSCNNKYNGVGSDWMSIYADLALMDGVIAAGEYAYRGDRYNFKGNLSDEMARMASIMCRATTLSTHMQAEILCTHLDRTECPFNEAHGWIVRGPRFSVCVMANVFCFVVNQSGVLNKVFARMRDRLMDVEDMV